MSAAEAFPSSVLVVDDEPIVLDVFSRVLQGRGLVIRTASTAEEAFRLLDAEGFGCVLADKNLPGLDGIELVRRVRRSQPYCACIVMTAYASTESAVEALRLGALDYLEKPFDDLERVADRIDEAVRAMRAEFDRTAVLSRLHALRSAGSNDDTPLGDLSEAPQAPPDASPIELLETRVQQATADLRRRSLQLLSRLVASKAAGREVLLSGEAVLEEVRRLRQMGATSEELARLEEQLEEHLALARHAQSR